MSSKDHEESGCGYDWGMICSSCSNCIFHIPLELSVESKVSIKTCLFKPQDELVHDGSLQNQGRLNDKSVREVVASIQLQQGTLYCIQCYMLFYVIVVVFLVTFLMYNFMYKCNHPKFLLVHPKCQLLKQPLVYMHPHYFVTNYCHG